MTADPGSTTGSTTGSDVRELAELTAEVVAVRAELARVDSKASALLAWAGTAFAILVAAIGVAGLPPLASGVVTVGTLLLGVAVAILLTVIRPSLPRAGYGTGFVRHAGASDSEELLIALTSNPTTRLADEVIRLSTVARAKYVRLRMAVNVLLVALPLLAALPVLAAVLKVGGRL